MNTAKTLFVLSLLAAAAQAAPRPIAPQAASKAPLAQPAAAGARLARPAAAAPRRGSVPVPAAPTVIGSLNAGAGEIARQRAQGGVSLAGAAAVFGEARRAPLPDVDDFLGGIQDVHVSKSIPAQYARPLKAALKRERARVETFLQAELGIKKSHLHLTRLRVVAHRTISPGATPVVRQVLFRVEVDQVFRVTKAAGSFEAELNLKDGSLNLLAKARPASEALPVTALPAPPAHPEGGEIFFSKDIPADFAALLSGVLRRKGRELQAFLKKEFGIDERGLGWTRLRVVDHRQVSPGLTTVVRAVRYTVELDRLGEESRKIGSFQAEVDLRSGALTLDSAESGAAAAVSPVHVDRWTRLVQKYLKSQKLAVQVRMYSEGPAGWAGGPNVLAIQLGLPRQPHVRINPYMMIKRLHDALEKGKGRRDLSWMGSLTWELQAGNLVYRNARPFARDRLSPQDGLAALNRLGKQKLVAYSTPSGVAPFAGAWAVERTAADDKTLRSMFGQGGWALHALGEAGSSAAGDYFLVWEGAVAQ